MSNNSSPGRQTRSSIKALLTLRHEHDLNPILLRIRVPEAKLLILSLIQLSRRNLESHTLVRLGGNNQILKILVGLFGALRESVHDLPLGRQLRRGIRVLQLKEQTLLSRHGVADLCDLVPRAANLDDVAARVEAGGDAGGQARGRVDVLLALLLLAGGTAGEVGLVLLALGVGEVGAVVLVDGQAEAALEGADVVFEEVGVLVEVDCLEGELAEAFAAVGVGGGMRGDTAAAEFGACAVLVVH